MFPPIAFTTYLLFCTTKKEELWPVAYKQLFPKSLVVLLAKLIGMLCWNPLLLKLLAAHQDPNEDWNFIKGLETFLLEVYRSKLPKRFRWSTFFWKFSTLQGQTHTNCPIGWELQRWVSGRLDTLIANIFIRSYYLLSQFSEPEQHVSCFWEARTDLHCICLLQILQFIGPLIMWIKRLVLRIVGSVGMAIWIIWIGLMFKELKRIVGMVV